MATIYESKTASDAWDVMAADGCFLGEFHVTPAGWFAKPKGSQVSLLPCDSRGDAFRAIIRLGVHHQDCGHK